MDKLSGFYVRDDGAIIQVQDDTVNIGGQIYTLVVKEGMIWMGDFWLTQRTETELIWDNEENNIVTWRKGEPDELRPIKTYLDGLARGPPTSQTVTGRYPISSIKGDVEAPPERPTQAADPSIRQPIIVETRADSIRPQDVNDMCVPKLREVDMLALHWEHLEKLAVDLNIVVKGSLGPTVIPKLRIAFSLKVLESLSPVLEVHLTFQQNIQLVDYDFWKIKDVLLRAYCTPNKLRNSIKTRLMNLKPLNLTKLENFLANCSAIVSIATRLRGENIAMEYCNVIAAIVMKLPEGMKKKIHAKLFSMAGDDRWELTIPFDEATKKSAIFYHYMGHVTLVDMIRLQCEIEQDLDLLSSTLPSPPKPDRVNRINETSADDFVSPFRSAYVVFMTPKASANLCHARLKTEGFEVRRYLSRKQNPYFVVASNLEATEADDKLKQLQTLGIKHREFEKRKNSNTDSPASPTNQ